MITRTVVEVTQVKYPISTLTEIPDQGSKIVDFFGRTVHVYKRNGKPTAVANTCMHFGGPLDFDIDQCKFVCQWHNAEFDADGKNLKGPASSASKLMFLSTRVEDDTLYYIWGE
jgi:nitrite reductase/ring-hydroxylating ferredoxin subunit